jgi:chromosomal replication initiator protein
MLTDTIWKEIKSSLKSRIPAHSYRMWVEPLKLVQFEDNRLVVSSPNFFSRKRVLEHYGGVLEEESAKATGSACQLVVKIGNGQNGSRPTKTQDVQLVLPHVNIRPHNGRLLRKDFTFDQFVVGGNNDFAYSASLSLASRKSTDQNTLFLFSGTGMGKSHLAQAIGHHILSEFPADKVYYITAEDFTNEMINAFRHDCFHEFKEKYRNGCDVLLLEDVHHISGKERTQTELSNTLDSLLEANKKIIFSSCHLPAQIPKLSDKLRSRLGFGLISTIKPPGFRTRVRILKRKSKMRDAHLPDDVLQYLASELTDDVRQLESGLIGVIAKSSLLGLPIDMSLATSVIENIVNARKKITIETIKKLVGREYQVSQAELVSKSRKQRVVRPRQVAIYLSRRYTDAPLQTIGRSFNRYHATAMHSINAVEQGMRASTAFRRQVDMLCKKLESGRI